MSFTQKIPTELRLFLSRGMQCARSGDYLEAKGFWAMALQRDPSCEVARLCMSLVNEYLDSPVRTANRSKPNIPAIVAAHGYDLSTFERVRQPNLPSGTMQPGADRTPDSRALQGDWPIRPESQSPRQTLTGHSFSRTDLDEDQPHSDEHDGPRTRGEWKAAGSGTPVPRRTSSGLTPRYKATTAPPPFKRQSRPDYRSPPQVGPSPELETAGDAESDLLSILKDEEVENVSIDAWSSPPPGDLPVDQGDQSQRSVRTKPGFSVPDEHRQESPDRDKPPLRQPPEEQTWSIALENRPFADRVDSPRLPSPARSVPQGMTLIGLGAHIGAPVPPDPLVDPFAVLRAGFHRPIPSTPSDDSDRTATDPEEERVERSVPRIIQVDELAMEVDQADEGLNHEDESADSQGSMGLRSDGSHRQAQELFEDNERKLAQRYSSLIGSMDTVFRRSIADDELRLHKLDAKKGFVLSYVDGVWTVEDIVDLVHFPREETIKLLAELYTAGIITS
ncbi:MAG: hypothetical protein JW797_16690 [Bradymonadales bacterium]|nr:hypothetical protein [Bradymonadales bacterium]